MDSASIAALRVYAPRGERLGVALALMIIAVTVAASGWFTQLDHFVFDFIQRASPSARPTGVVVVGIDQASLQAVGRWPWSRRTHAQLLRKVCAGKPKVVAYDVAFSETGADPVANAELADAIRSCGNVVLPVILETTRQGGQALEVNPIPELAQVAAGSGRVSVRIDDDGVVRGIDLWEGVGSAALPLMAQTVMRVAEQASDLAPLPPTSLSSTASPYLVSREGFRMLQFAGPTGTVPSLSASDLLNGSSTPSVLQDQVVFVGATAVGMGDLFPTPVTTHGALMPGVEVLVNVYMNMRDRRFVEPVPASFAVPLSALLAVIPLFWVSRLMPLTGLIASIVWLLSLLILAMALPLVLHRWMAPTGALAAAVSVYPLWSWRRLEAFKRHVDWELQHLAGISSINPLPRLGFEHRLAYVQQAQARFLDLQIQRDETLAFFSHDIRAPLANAAQQLAAGELTEAGQRHLVLQLNRAHELAQGFLSLIRAKNLEPRVLREIDVGAVLHQAADAAYEEAMTRSIQLVRRIPDEPVWIRADFGLLERAVSNLLANALQFSPDQTQITLELSLGERHVLISVTDQGPGVADDRVPYLFQRFASNPAAMTHGSSTGLGLYFVQTVAHRHGGMAGYEPAAQGGARFWIELPRN